MTRDHDTLIYSESLARVILLVCAVTARWLKSWSRPQAELGGRHYRGWLLGFLQALSVSREDFCGTRAQADQVCYTTCTLSFCSPGRACPGGWGPAQAAGATGR